MNIQQLKQQLRRNVIRPAGEKFFRLFPNQAARYRLNKEVVAIRAEADRFFADGNQLPEGASREDYYKALETHAVSISEYLHQYEFYKLTEAERDEFISRALMRALAMKLKMQFPNDMGGLSRFKEISLATITEKGFCHREWLFAPESTIEEFTQLVSTRDCIIKPYDGSLGIGVKAISKLDDPEAIKALYKKCVKGKMLVEEYIKGCEETQSFHPSSLNTIRFVTMSFRGKAVPFGAFFRMGVGKMAIDNAHAGGLFAQINVETGVIESDGITTDGMRVTNHPDTNKQIKGFQIPQWKEIVEFCLSAARQTQNIISGWDVVITDKGVPEFVEVNNRPDFDLMQSPLRVGVKRKVFSILSELTGKNIKI